MAASRTLLFDVSPLRFFSSFPSAVATKGALPRPSTPSRPTPPARRRLTRGSSSPSAPSTPSPPSLPPAPPPTPRLALRRGSARRALSQLDAYLSAKKFLVGDTPTLADVAVVGSLANLMRHVVGGAAREDAERRAHTPMRHAPSARFRPRRRGCRSGDVVDASDAWTVPSADAAVFPSAGPVTESAEAAPAASGGGDAEKAPRRRRRRRRRLPRRRRNSRRRRRSSPSSRRPRRRRRRPAAVRRRRRRGR